MCPADALLDKLSDEAGELCRILSAIVMAARRNDRRADPRRD
jgi:hypothetical protein